MSKLASVTRIAALVVASGALNGVARAQTPCTWGPGGVPGTPDCRFGNGAGIVMRTGPGNFLAASSAAIQPDGKIVLAAWGSPNPSATGEIFYVLRYNADGTPDTSFGAGGMASVAMDSDDDAEFTSGIALQQVGADLRILVSGGAHVGAKGKATLGFAVARFTSAGILDATFGSGGRVIFAPTSDGASALALAVQCDQKIVLAGGLSAARLTPNGALDTSFGPTHNGIVTLSGISGSLTSIALQPTGSGPSGCSPQRVITAGNLVVQLSKKTTSWDMLVAAFTPAGLPDTSFGTNGRTQIDFAGQSDRALGLTVDGANRIVGKGVVNSPGVDFGLFRLTSNGQLDPIFGVGGKVVTDFGQRSDNPEGGLMIDSEGRIIVGGTTAPSGNLSASDWMIVRYNDNGSLDGSFGTGGISIVDAGAGEGGGVTAIDSLGRILVAGSTNSSHTTVVTALNP